MENNFIYEQKPDHHYRTEIPNIVFKLGLSPQAICLYVYYKRVAGDGGSCWKSKDVILEEVGMSVNCYLKYRKELSQSFSILNDKPLIAIEERRKENGGDDTRRIHIVDVWKENGGFFRNEKNIKESQKRTGGVLNMNGGGSKYEHKEEPSQEEPSLRNDDVDVLSKKEILLKPLGLDQTAFRFALKYNIEQIQVALEVIKYADDIKCISRYFTSALNEAWKPKLPEDLQKKLHEQKQEQEEILKYHSKMEVIKNKMQGIVNQYRGKLKDSIELGFDFKYVFVKTKKQIHNVCFDEAGLRWLEVFISHNLL